MATVCLLIGLIGLTGCKTHIEQGPYAGQEKLYYVDASIASIADGLDAFLAWEAEHRAYLSDHPEITALANRIRKEAPSLLQEAVRLRDILAKEDNLAAKDEFDRIYRILHGMLEEALRYQTQLSHER